MAPAAVAAVSAHRGTLSPTCFWGRRAEEHVLDPITGLIAFPSFLTTFRRRFFDLLQAFDGVGLAIGDVDHLKTYVESENRRDPLLFGHLAGNAFMSRLGLITLECGEQLKFPWKCLATFGGDELIVAGAGCSRGDFIRSIGMLSRELAAGLPRTVSFAHCWFSLASSGRAFDVEDTAAESLCLSAIATVDRALFQSKARRVEGATNGSPILTVMRPRRLHQGRWSAMRSLQNGRGPQEQS